MSWIFLGKPVWLRLIPIPTMTAGWAPGSVMHSHKIPAIFLPFNKISFGHLSFADVCCGIADMVATPAINERQARFSGGKSGFRSTER